jgi:hypothetical protein
MDRSTATCEASRRWPVSGRCWASTSGSTSPQPAGSRLWEALQAVMANREWLRPSSAGPGVGRISTASRLVDRGGDTHEFSPVLAIVWPGEPRGGQHARGRTSPPANAGPKPSRSRHWRGNGRGGSATASSRMPGWAGGSLPPFGRANAHEHLPSASPGPARKAGDAVGELFQRYVESEGHRLRAVAAILGVIAEYRLDSWADLGVVRDSGHTSELPEALGYRRVRTKEFARELLPEVEGVHAGLEYSIDDAPKVETELGLNPGRDL